mmetsp:Transcript_269/g.496  ORF Transcript_269/g.496 Transcript_269/m.496 type:complete len:1109 (+) Transcript_269:53-3379(+)
MEVEYQGILQSRKATVDDVDGIKRLIGEESFVVEKRYGTYDVETLVETEYLSMVITDDNNDVVGFAVFSPEPKQDTPDMKRMAWSSFTRQHFKDDLNQSKFSLTNSLWLTFYQCEPLMKDIVRQEMFESVFEMYPQVDYLLHAVKVLTPTYDPINVFEHEKPEEDLKTDLYSLNRHDYVRKLKIRMGRVEDNDDITPLLKLANLTTLKIEGEFWLSDKLHHQNETRKVIVAEMDGQVVGVTYITHSSRNPREVVNTYDTTEFEEFITHSEEGGESVNALEVQMFFILPEYKDRSIDFMNVAFNFFPTCKYATIFLPFTESEHPLLAPFVITQPHYNVSCAEALHVLSRNSFYDTFHVITGDTNLISKEEVLASLPHLFNEELNTAELDKEFISQVTSAFDESSNDSVYIMRNQEEKIIGVAVLRDQFDETFIRKFYNVDDFINFDFYQDARQEIVNIFIDPLYVKHSRTFLMGIFSVSQQNLIVYKPDALPLDILNQFMLCLTPRRNTQEYDAQTVPVYEFPVYFLTRRLISEPKMVIHSRIIVVGASKTGLSFLKTLVQIPYLHFTNLYIVSPDGLDKTEELYHLFVGDTTDLKHQELLILLKRPNINIVYDKLESIERQDKEIVCTSSNVLPYEYLILAVSRFYSMPSTVTDIPGFPEMGVVSLRNEIQFQEELETYTKFVLDNSNELTQIVLYGSNEDTFTTAHVLITKYNVPSSKITLVSPDGSADLFADDRLESKMNRLLDSYGITKYNHYCFEKFIGDEDDRLKCVVISNTPEFDLYRRSGRKEPPNKKVYEIPCGLFINCHETNVDNNLLVTFAKMSLVFDGRLIVDPQFRTTDKLIYSAGPLAKFSRKFGISEKMENSNSHELGKCMAYCVLKSLGIEEFYKTHIEPDLTLIQRVPTFKNKVKTMGEFIGGNKYFRVRMRHHKDEDCMDMVTDFVLTQDDSKSFNPSRYTCLKINKFNGLISQITTFGPETLEYNNLSCWVGLPLSYCNGLVKRYEEGLIPDLITYLRENWALAIFCDKFKSFKSSIDLSQFKEITDFAEQTLDNVKSGKHYSILEVHPSIRDIIKDESKHTIQRALLDYLEERQNREGTIKSVYCIPDH